MAELCEDENHILVIHHTHLILSSNLFSSIDLLPVCLRYKSENSQFGFPVSFSMGPSDYLFTVGINHVFDAYFSNHLHPLPFQEGC